LTWPPEKIKTYEIKLIGGDKSRKVRIKMRGK